MRRMGIGLPAVAGRAAAAAAAAACAALLALSAFVPSAFANREISAPTLPDGSTMTVSDDVTRIQVDKLDERTHEAVKGARMQILARDTGEVVDEWTTDGATHVLEKGLDVDVVYILREAEAPEGYAKIDDVEFLANEVEGTGITLLTERERDLLTNADLLAMSHCAENARQIRRSTEDAVWVSCSEVPEDAPHSELTNRVQEAVSHCEAPDHTAEDTTVGGGESRGERGISYIAVFNLDDEERGINVWNGEVASRGYKGFEGRELTELWTGQTVQPGGSLAVTVPAHGVRTYKY